MKTLITGGAGFLGSHLCEALLEGGCIENAVDVLGEMHTPSPVLCGRVLAHQHRVSDAIGNPLEDVAVVLRPAASGDYRMGYETRLVGHPLHADTVWSARSGGLGEIVFAVLPR